MLLLPVSALVQWYGLPHPTQHLVTESCGCIPSTSHSGVPARTVPQRSTKHKVGHKDPTKLHQAACRDWIQHWPVAGASTLYLQHLDSMLEQVSPLIPRGSKILPDLCAAHNGTCKEDMIHARLSRWVVPACGDLLLPSAAPATALPTTAALSCLPDISIAVMG